MRKRAWSRWIMELLRHHDPRKRHARPHVLTHTGHAHAATETAEDPLTGLLDHLAVVPDPRRPQGTRYLLPAILAMVVRGMRGSGHDTASAAVEWAHRAEPALLMRAGSGLRPRYRGRVPVPTERTVAKVLKHLDAHAAHAPARHAYDDVPEREHRRTCFPPAPRPIPGGLPGR